MFLNESKNTVSDGSLFISVAFFSVSFMSMNPVPDASGLIDNLPPFYKQRNARFFPAYVYAATTIILRLPWIALDSFLWSIMVYFMVGFTSNGWRFIVFWAVNAMVQLFSLTLFTAIGAICRAQTTTSAVESFILLIFMNTAGFVIYPASIQGGWIGAYWSNPWAYFLRALSINEMTSGDWSSPASTTGGETLGDAVLASRSFPTSYSWVWISLFAWGIGASIINFVLLSLALTFLGPLQGAVAAADTTTDDKKTSSLLQISSIPSTTVEKDVEMGAEAAAPSPDPAMAPVTTSLQETETPPAGLKFTPLTMTFKDLKYSIPISGGTMSSADGPHAGQLLLLKGITGSFRPGILTALMGASGAGKTTLLDVLAGRKTSGVISGDIMVNGFPKESTTFAKVSGYCEQEDIHEPLATVHEALLFSARLRLSSKLSSTEVDTFVQEVEDLVELTPLKTATVGVPGQSGLSVEQRKRLTLAIELVANPAIIFLDEPTSGLDARAAGVVMRAIRATASTGRAVVATIHQPSSSIFSAFDELLLLKRGGETIFFGPLGGGNGAPLLVSYLESLPKVPRIDPGTNPANWMLDVTSPDAETQNGVNFAELYKSSDLAQRTLNQVNELSSSAGSNNTPLSLTDMAVPSWCRQFAVLLQRDAKSYRRDMSYNLTRIVISLVIAICYGTLYQNQGSAYTTTAGIFNIAGAIFASVLFLGVIDALMVQEVATRKRVVYYREHAASFYSCSAFSLSEAVIELPYLVVQAVLYSVIVYFAIGFAVDVGKFFWFLAVMIITLFTFTFFGQLLVHVTPNLQLAGASFAFALSGLQLFCGFLKPYGLIPRGWKWAYWLDPLSYTLYALVGDQLGNVEELTTLPDGTTKLPVRVFVQETFGFKYSFVKWTIVIMIAFAFAFRILAFMALKYLKFQSR
jgi:ABC-type multidrug transport system ATPase subunit/ABC-type multidrug transport system permease subunit